MQAESLGIERHLLVRSVKGANVYGVAASRGHAGILEGLDAWVANQFSMADAKSFRRGYGPLSENALHMAVESALDGTAATKHVMLVDAALAQEADRNGRTAWQLAYRRRAEAERLHGIEARECFTAVMRIIDPHTPLDDPAPQHVPAPQGKFLPAGHAILTLLCTLMRVLIGASSVRFTLCQRSSVLLALLRRPWQPAVHLSPAARALPCSFVCWSGCAGDFSSDVAELSSIFNTLRP